MQPLFSRDNYVRFAAWGTLIAFAFTSVAKPSSVSAAVIPPAPLSVSIDQIEIPAQWGTVQDRFQGNPNSPLVLYIQDAHSITDAQRNAANLIRHFQKKYGVNLMAIEGTKGKLDPALLQSFPDDFVKRKVMREYLEAGEIGGPELAAVLSAPGLVVEGLEDWDLYEKNYSAYLRAIKNREPLLGKFAEIRKGLDARKEKEFSKDLKKFHDAWTGFQEEKTDLFKFLSSPGLSGGSTKNYSQLHSLMQSLHADNPHLTPPPGRGRTQEGVDTQVRRMAEAFRKKKFQQLPAALQKEFNQHDQSFTTNQEDAGTFLKFFKKAAASIGLRLKLTPAMQEILGRHETLASIQGTKLFDELESFARQREDELAKTKAEKNLVAEFRKLRILNQLAKLEWTREQMDEYSADPEAYLQLLGESRKAIFSALQFYRDAMARDQIFHDNLLAMMKRENQKTAMVLTGGFHARGFEKALREKGISYAVIMPKMNSLEGAEHYEAVMKGEVSFEKYFQSTYYDAFMRHASEKLVGQLSQPDFKRTLKLWRDNILRELSRQGRLGDAAKYTRYVDLLIKVYNDRFGNLDPSSVKKEEILKAVEEALSKLKESKIQTLQKTLDHQLQFFMKGLGLLKTENRLNGEEVRQLAAKTVQQLPAALGPGVTAAVFNPKIPAEFRDLITGRREIIRADSPELLTGPLAQNVSNQTLVTATLEAIQTDLSVDQRAVRAAGQEASKFTNDLLQSRQQLLNYLNVDVPVSTRPAPVAGNELRRLISESIQREHPEFTKTQIDQASALELQQTLEFSARAEVRKEMETSASKDGWLEKEVMVSRAHGVHPRAAVALVEAAKKYSSTGTALSLKVGDEALDLTSMRDLWMRGIVSGQKVTVRAKGPKAEQAVSVIAAILTATDEETLPVSNEQAVRDLRDQEEEVILATAEARERAAGQKSSPRSETRLDPGVDFGFRLAFEELLSNAARKAGTTLDLTQVSGETPNVRVRLLESPKIRMERSQRGIRILIEDNGPGFDLDVLKESAKYFYEVFRNQIFKEKNPDGNLETYLAAIDNEAEREQFKGWFEAVETIVQQKTPEWPHYHRFVFEMPSGYAILSGRQPTPDVKFVTIAPHPARRIENPPPWAADALPQEQGYTFLVAGIKNTLEVPTGRGRDLAQSFIKGKLKGDFTSEDEFDNGRGFRAMMDIPLENLIPAGQDPANPDVQEAVIDEIRSLLKEAAANAESVQKSKGRDVHFDLDLGETRSELRDVSNLLARSEVRGKPWHERTVTEGLDEDKIVNGLMSVRNDLGYVKAELAESGWDLNDVKDWIHAEQFLDRVINRYRDTARKFNAVILNGPMTAETLKTHFLAFHAELGKRGLIEEAGTVLDEKDEAKIDEIFKYLFSEKFAGRLADNPLRAAASIFTQLVNVQGFSDGNKRAASFILNFILMKAGYEPFILDSENAAAYFNVVLPIRERQRVKVDAFEKFLEDHTTKRSEVRADTPAPQAEVLSFEQAHRRHEMIYEQGRRELGALFSHVLNNDLHAMRLAVGFLKLAAEENKPLSDEKKSAKIHMMMHRAKKAVIFLEEIASRQLYYVGPQPGVGAMVTRYTTPAIDRAIEGWTEADWEKALLRPEETQALDNQIQDLPALVDALKTKFKNFYESIPIDISHDRNVTVNLKDIGTRYENLEQFVTSAIDALRNGKEPMREWIAGKTGSQLIPAAPTAARAEARTEMPPSVNQIALMRHYVAALLPQLTALGFDEETILKAMIAGTEFFVHFGFESGAQVMWQMDLFKQVLPRLIKEKAKTGDKAFMVAGFGLGLQPLEASQLIREVDKVLKEQVGEDAKNWTYQFIGFDDSEVSLRNAQLVFKAVHPYLEKKLSFGKILMTAYQGNFLDLEAIEQGRREAMALAQQQGMPSKTGKADVILMRYSDYTNWKIIDGNLKLNHSNVVSDDVDYIAQTALFVRSFLALKHALEVFGKPASFFLTEPAKEFLTASLQMKTPVLLLPHAELVTPRTLEKDLGLSGLPAGWRQHPLPREGSLGDRGGGILWFPPGDYTPELRYFSDLERAIASSVGGNARNELRKIQTAPPRSEGRRNETLPVGFKKDQSFFQLFQVILRRDRGKDLHHEGHLDFQLADIFLNLAHVNLKLENILLQALQRIQLFVDQLHPVTKNPELAVQFFKKYSRFAVAGIFGTFFVRFRHQFSPIKNSEEVGNLADQAGSVNINYSEINNPFFAYILPGAFFPGSLRSELRTEDKDKELEPYRQAFKDLTELAVRKGMHQIVLLFNEGDALEGKFQVIFARKPNPSEGIKGDAYYEMDLDRDDVEMRRIFESIVEDRKNGDEWDIWQGWFNRELKQLLHILKTQPLIWDESLEEELDALEDQALEGRSFDFNFKLANKNPDPDKPWKGAKITVDINETTEKIEADLDQRDQKITHFIARIRSLGPKAIENITDDIAEKYVWMASDDELYHFLVLSTQLAIILERTDGSRESFLTIWEHEEHYSELSKILREKSRSEQRSVGKTMEPWVGEVTKDFWAAPVKNTDNLNAIETNLRSEIHRVIDAKDRNMTEVNRTILNQAAGNAVDGIRVIDHLFAARTQQKGRIDIYMDEAFLAAQSAAMQELAGVLGLAGISEETSFNAASAFVNFSQFKGLWTALQNFKSYPEFKGIIISFENLNPAEMDSQAAILKKMFNRVAVAVQKGQEAPLHGHVELRSILYDVGSQDSINEKKVNRDLGDQVRVMPVFHSGIPIQMDANGQWKQEGILIDPALFQELAKPDKLGFAGAVRLLQLLASPLRRLIQDQIDVKTGLPQINADNIGTILGQVFNAIQTSKLSQSAA